MKEITVALLAISFLALTNAHTYHMGECPVVQPVTDFQMSRVSIYFINLYLSGIFIGSKIYEN